MKVSTGGGCSFSFAALHSSGKFLLQLGDCTVDLSTCQVDVVINLGLVLLVDRRHGKEQDVSQDENGDSIEDSSYVGQQPHDHSQLQGVHEVLDQEEVAHLLQGSVDVGQTGVHVLAEGLWGDADILIYQRFEGVPLVRLLHGLDHRLVDAEGDGDTQQCQQQVGDHADDAEGCQRQQQQQGQTEHQARLLGISPVDQILHRKF